MENSWQIVSWAAVLIAIAGYYFNVKKQKICFVIWELAAIALILVNMLGTKDMAQAFLNVVYFVINIYGWISWRKDEANCKV